MALRGTGRDLGAVMSGSVSTTDRQRAERAGSAAAAGVVWTSTYLRTAALLDCMCAFVAALIALEVRFDAQGGVPAGYFAFSPALPLLCLCSVPLSPCPLPPL